MRGTRVRDVWHSYVADGNRYGYIHTVVVRLPDGNYRITRDSRLLVDLLGLNKEEITERGDYVVTADYRPVSIAVEGKRQSGSTRIIGRSRGAAFEVTATVAGINRSGVFDRPGEILPEPCLDDWLADRPAGFAAGEVTLLAEESCMPKPAKVRRLDARPGEPGAPGRSTPDHWTAISGSSWTPMACVSSGRPRGASWSSGVRRPSRLATSPIAR